MFKDCNLFCRANKFTLQKWPGSSADLNAIKKFCTVHKDKVAQNHSQSIPALIEAIKSVWIREVPEEFCKAVIKAKG